MKKLLVTTAATLLTVAAFAQGTVIFSNNAGERLSTGIVGADPSTYVAVPLAGVPLNYGLFYGIGQSTSLSLVPTLGVNSTTGLGLIANAADGKSAINLLGVGTTTPGETDVWLQIKGWSRSFGTDWQAASTAYLDGSGVNFFGVSAIVNAPAMGPATGPGASIWQFSTGTSLQQIKPFAMLTTVVPEPTTMALAGLGIASLLIFRRRK